MISDDYNRKIIIFYGSKYYLTIFPNFQMILHAHIIFINIKNVK